LNQKIVGYPGRSIMHTKSAKKRLRQNLENRDRNRSTKTMLKTQIKKIRDAVKAGDFKAADTQASTTAQKFDRAAAKKIIHKNVASRTKSRIAKFIKAGKTAAKAK
jgi:small subunit ribosomal protein S20